MILADGQYLYLLVLPALDYLKSKILKRKINLQPKNLDLVHSVE